MAEQEPTPIDNEEPEETPGYKAPAQKTLDEIKNLDNDDESLVRYKETLLAGVDPAAGIIYFFVSTDCFLTKYIFNLLFFFKRGKSYTKNWLFDCHKIWKY